MANKAKKWKLTSVERVLADKKERERWKWKKDKTMVILSEALFDMAMAALPGGSFEKSMLSNLDKARKLWDKP